MGIYTFAGATDAPTVQTNFNGVVKFFPSKVVYLNTALTGALNITAELNNAIVGSVIIVRLTANGTNVPTFATNIKALGTPVWTNTSGTANILQFLFDGVDVWYTILPQPGAVSGGGGTTPPVADPKTTLSGFSINTAGNNLLYSTTLATTGIAGTISVAGVSRTLTHVSSGVASFNGVTVKVGEAVTVTLTGSVPESNTVITAVAVTNNSTQTAGSGVLVSQALTYTLWGTATNTNGVISIPNTVSGFVVNEPINGGENFVLEMTAPNNLALAMSPNKTESRFGDSVAAGFLTMDINNAIQYSTNNGGNLSNGHGGGGSEALRITKNGANLDLELKFAGVWYPYSITPSFPNPYNATNAPFYLKVLQRGTGAANGWTAGNVIVKVSK